MNVLYRIPIRLSLIHISVFLHQSMPRLDLYCTVDAAVCCLDSLNYLTDPKDVQRTFRRLHLFVAPGGMLVFDVNTKRENDDDSPFGTDHAGL